MKPLVIVASMLTCGVTGCGKAALDLTAEQARTAMIELIRSPEPGQLKDFPLDQFVNDGVKIYKDGSTSWGPFSFSLNTKEYTYEQAFGEAPRVCRWHYRGGFEFKGHQWFALPPRVEWQALGPE